MQAADGPFIGMEISETNLLKYKTLPDRIWKRPWLGANRNPWFNFKEFKKIPQVNGPLGDTGKPSEYCFQQAS